MTNGVLTPNAAATGNTIGMARTYRPQLDEVAKVKKAMTAKITAGKIMIVMCGEIASITYMVMPSSSLIAFRKKPPITVDNGYNMTLKPVKIDSTWVSKLKIPWAQ